MLLQPCSVASPSAAPPRAHGLWMTYFAAWLQAADKGEVPVGAVLVIDGQIAARAHNTVETSGNPTAHAEMQCIQHAAAAAEQWRLLNATLYVTLEPCPMCAGAVLQSRIGTVVYGTANPLLGELLRKHQGVW